MVIHLTSNITKTYYKHDRKIYICKYNITQIGCLWSSFVSIDSFIILIRSCHVIFHYNLRLSNSFYKKLCLVHKYYVVKSHIQCVKCHFVIAFTKNAEHRQIGKSNNLKVFESNKFKLVADWSLEMWDNMKQPAAIPVIPVLLHCAILALPVL